jgi:hypothetical protein
MMKAATVKADKAPVEVTEFRQWCEHCCIRIAPHEERTAVGKKNYHPRCYSKMSSAAAKAKA